MIELWIVFALLLMPAAWLLMLPLRRSGSVARAQQAVEARDDVTAQNVAIYRRREASLEAAHARGDINAERFAEDLRELQRSLLDDASQQEKSSLKGATSGKLAVPLVLLAVIVASLFWYHEKGAAGNLALYQTIEQARQNGDSVELVTALEQQAKQQPDNPQVWRTLYPLYRDGGQLEQARHALQQLISLDGRHPWWLAELAQLEYFQQGRQLTPEVQALVDEVLAQNANEPTVMGLLGIDAFEHEDFDNAIDYWRRALAADLPPAVAGAMREGIAVAQARIAAVSSGSDKTMDSAANIQVHLSLANGIGADLPADTSVFVVARDSEGRLPPLAIRRVSLGELPLTLSLGVNDAMSPMASLADAQEVRLVARVSRSGQAQPQPGDLWGEQQKVAVSDVDADPVALTIDRVVE
uniref:c-type cytochrome biogenesis protein CcmI n=1 Tax=Halomonas sp. TaxID=1486246 RepID=UPI00261B0B60|nr:c-type cytochrome biogenesis protein CcmI [Halomonas sp.]